MIIRTRLLGPAERGLSLSAVGAIIPRPCSNTEVRGTSATVIDNFLRGCASGLYLPERREPTSCVPFPAVMVAPSVLYERYCL